MKASDSPVYLALVDDRVLKADKLFFFGGSLDIIQECENIYPICNLLGLFHSIRDDIDCILSFSSYNRIRVIDGRYVKIYAGASLFKVLKYMGLYRRVLTTFIPPIMFESLGGLIAQGYPIWSEELDENLEVKMHVMDSDKVKRFISLHDFSGGVIFDFHLNNPRKIRGISPSLVKVRLGRNEVEYILRNSERILNPFSIFRSGDSYLLYSLSFDRGMYRSLSDVILKIVSKDRINRVSLESLDIDQVDIVNLDFKGDRYLGVLKEVSPDFFFFHHPTKVAISTKHESFEKIFNGVGKYG